MEQRDSSGIFFTDTPELLPAHMPFPYSVKRKVWESVPVDPRKDIETHVRAIPTYPIYGEESVFDPVVALSMLQNQPSVRSEEVLQYAWQTP